VAVSEEEWKIVWHHGFQGIFRTFIHIHFCEWILTKIHSVSLLVHVWKRLIFPD